MGKYLKLFETHAEYTSYISGSDKVLPKAKHIRGTGNLIHYSKCVSISPSP